MPRRCSSSNVHGRVIRDEKNREASGGSIPAFYAKWGSERLGPSQQKASKKSGGKLLETRSLRMGNKPSPPPARSLHNCFLPFIPLVQQVCLCSSPSTVGLGSFFIYIAPSFANARAHTHVYICVYYFSLPSIVYSPIFRLFSCFPRIVPCFVLRFSIPDFLFSIFLTAFLLVFQFQLRSPGAVRFMVCSPLYRS